VGWGEVDDRESMRALQTALDMGITFFDTADVYGAGHSERILGEALGEKKNDVVISTKFGNVFDEERRQITGEEASPEYIRTACEASLRRLDRDYIDLYLFHLNGFPVEKAGPVRDTLEELATEGKIRFYGWSTDFPDAAKFFAEGEHCSAVEVELNVIDDAPEIVEICENYDLACINRGPLAMGILTGKYGSSSFLGDEDVRGSRSPGWMKYFEGGKPAQEWLSKMERVRTALTADGRSLAQGALGWLWRRSEKTIPIPGFRTVAQVQENARAMEYGLLEPARMREIRDLLKE
jgi:aryl-alcohol dehydrogenase-like predicted oxidoreductase